MSKHSITIQTTAGPKVLPIKVSLSGDLYKASVTCICLKTLSHKAKTEGEAVAGLRAAYQPHMEADIQMVKDFMADLAARQRPYVVENPMAQKAMDKRTHRKYMDWEKKRRRK